MTVALQTHDSAMAPIAAQHGRVITGATPEALAEIYADSVNLAIWQRALPDAVASAARSLSLSAKRGTTSLTVSPASARASVLRALEVADDSPLVDDICELIDMFACLFECDSVGVRIAALERAMCPRFHVDHVPCRLITTYTGVATEWLPEYAADRSRLGKASVGKADHESGIFTAAEDIQQLQAGEVALLKGEAWLGNEGHGVIHRSPAVPDGNWRLVVTMDMV